MKDNVPYINIHTHRKLESELSITSRGTHPYDVLDSDILTLEDITPEVEAIGEIGLDFSVDIDHSTQEGAFIAQLKLAERLKMPVVLHAVRSVDRIMQIIKVFNLKAVIFHGFIGSWQQAQVAIQKGYFLSFGHRTFSSPKTLDVLRKVPINHIFLETDDYDIKIEEIYKMASEYRSETLDQIKDNIYKNYIHIFKK